MIRFLWGIYYCCSYCHKLFVYGCFVCSFAMWMSCFGICYWCYFYGLCSLCIQPGGFSIMKTLLLMWCLCHTESHGVMCMFSGLLEVWSTIYMLQSWLLCGLCLSGHWCFWGEEFCSAIVFSSFIPNTNIMNIPEAIFHCLPVNVLVSQTNIL